MALDVAYPIAFDRLWEQGYDEFFIGRRDFNQYGDSFQPKHALEAPLLHHSLTANLSAWLRAVPGLDIPNEIRPSPHVSEDNKTRVHEVDWKRAESAADWLHKRAASGSDKPFALSVGLIIPHPVYTTSRYWYDQGVNASRVSLPAHYDVGDQPWPLAYDSLSKNVTWWPMDYWTDDEQRLVRHTYAAMAAETDAIMGVVLDALRESGLGDDTVVLCWSDHGDMAMTHWSWYKESVLEGASRVPLIVAGPGVAAGRAVDRATSLLDLFPTMMDLAGAPHPSGAFQLDGHSLVPDLQPDDAASRLYSAPEGAPAHPDYAITQWHGDHGNTGQFAVRQGDLKYIYYSPFVPSRSGTPSDAASLPLASNVTPGAAYSVLFNVTADRDEMVDLRAELPSDAQRLHAILLAELSDPDAIDAEAKAWDKCMWAKWRSDVGQGNASRVKEVMANPGNRFWWVWRADPEKWFGMIADWEAADGGPNMTACVDPFHTDDDDGPGAWHDDVVQAPGAAGFGWRFPRPEEHWPLSSTITAGPEDYRAPHDHSAGAAERIAWAEAVNAALAGK